MTHHVVTDEERENFKGLSDKLIRVVCRCNSDYDENCVWHGQIGWFCKENGNIKNLKDLSKVTKLFQIVETRFLIEINKILVLNNYQPLPTRKEYNNMLCPEIAEQLAIIKESKSKLKELKKKLLIKE